MKNRIILYLVIGFVCSVAFVFALYKLSDDISHYSNNFIRRFPYQVVRLRDADLGHNSYYFAGEGDSKLYLGNYTTPLLLTIVDTSLAEIQRQRVKLKQTELPFHSVDIVVTPPTFIVTDGNVPCLFSGNIVNWEADLNWRGIGFFSRPIPGNENQFGVRTLKANGQASLGLLSNTEKKLEIHPEILTKQIDGNFDVDGSLHFDRQAGNFVWVYRYRNQFIVMDSQLKILSKGKTIDTISRAQIEVASVKSRGERKMSKPPLIVNRSSALYKNLLYVNSGLIGRYEDASTWQGASVIDVYDIDAKKYLSSFYIHNVNGKRVRSFHVVEDRLYVFIDTHLISYKISPSITVNYRKLLAGSRDKAENL
nr:hypothetical protein [uncultured Flavobacterium sp.]